MTLHANPPPRTLLRCNVRDNVRLQLAHKITYLPKQIAKLPQQEHHFRQRPELIKIVCGIYKSNVIHPPFPPAICRMVTTAGNGNVLFTLVVQGFRVHTRGATATNESDKYSKILKKLYIIQTSAFWQSNLDKIDLYLIYDSFKVSNKIPFAQFQTKDVTPVFKIYKPLFMNNTQ